MDRVVVELNELRPDVVLCTGDLTEMGFRQDYVLAREYLERIECPQLVVIPGNHDARNVGYVHFEELIGPRWQTLQLDEVTIVAEDSTEPDLDHGQIGRARYDVAARAVLAARPRSASSCCTTTCCRCPAPGASATSSTTPATCSRCCRSAASTSCSAATSTCPTPGGSSASSWSTPAPAARCACAGTPRPATTSCASTAIAVDVVRKYPFHGTETLIDFVPSTASFEKYVCPVPEEDRR